VRSLSSVSFFRCRHRLVVLCGLGTYVSTSSALPLASIQHSRAWPSICSTLFGHPSPFVEAWFTNLALNRKPGKFAADSFSPSHQLMTSTHCTHTQEKKNNKDRWNDAPMIRVCEHVGGQEKMNKVNVRRRRPQVSHLRSIKHQEASIKVRQAESPAPYSSVSAVSPAKAPLAMVLIWLKLTSLHRQTTA
jgi:hypothetical protein